MLLGPSFSAPPGVPFPILLAPRKGFSVVAGTTQATAVWGDPQIIARERVPSHAVCLFGVGGGQRVSPARVYPVTHEFDVIGIYASPVTTQVVAFQSGRYVCSRDVNQRPSVGEPLPTFKIKSSVSLANLSCGPIPAAGLLVHHELGSEPIFCSAFHRHTHSVGRGRCRHNIAQPVWMRT